MQNATSRQVSGNSEQGFYDVKRSFSESIPGIAFTLLAGFVILITLYAAAFPVAVVSYERDIWHHLAVYRELIASPFYAENPHVATSDPSRSYSPWTMAVALLAKATGGDAFGAVLLSSTITIFALMIGIHQFARQYWQSNWAPFAFLVVFLGTWIIHINHTGYQTVSTFLFAISYPFGIVLAVGFLAWALVIRLVKNDDNLLGGAVLLAVLAWFMFITHQLQGLFAICAAASFALFYGRAPLARRAALCVALVVGLLATRYWWYFDPIGYVLSDEVREGHRAVRLLTYSLNNVPFIIGTLGLSCLGAIGFFDYHKRSPRYELLLAFCVILAGFVLLLIKENWVSVRIVPFLVLYLQLGLASFLLEPRKNFGARTWISAALVAVLSYSLVTNIQLGWRAYTRAAGFLVIGGTETPPSTWSRDILRASAHAEKLVPEGSTAIAHLQTAFPIEATSLNVVSIPRLFAEVPDMLERQDNTTDFFGADTSLVTRCQILARYDVSLIVYRGVWLDDAVEKQLDAFGERSDVGDMSFIPANAAGEFDICKGA